MDSQIGRQAGQFPKRSGAAGFMAKVALTSEAGAPLCLNLTIATLDLRIGCRAGLSQKNHGAVRTKARVARQRVVDVLERELDGLL